MPEFPTAGPGNLLRRVIEALRDLPGACELYVFGSLADGTADAYSDIDLEVTTRDAATSATALDGVLTIVAPIEVDWQMATPDDTHPRTILFRGEAYYHMLDIDLHVFGRIQGYPMSGNPG
jgi:predicted nucleotidyltransferase